MDINNLSIRKLDSIRTLVAKRDKLAAELEAITNSIEKELASSAGKVSGIVKKRGRKAKSTAKKVVAKMKKSAKPKKAKAVKANSTAKSGGRRGSKKAKILAMLKAAGNKGVTAKEVTEKLKMQNQHVHSWFGNTGKNVPGLEKIASGHWVLKS
ncbi:MAG: hypothetical protein ACK5LK_03820 [Chthoniobacterales bacterium]